MDEGAAEIFSLRCASNHGSCLFYAHRIPGETPKIEHIIFWDYEILTIREDHRRG